MTQFNSMEEVLAALSAAGLGEPTIIGLDQINTLQPGPEVPSTDPTEDKIDLFVEFSMRQLAFVGNQLADAQQAEDMSKVEVERLQYALDAERHAHLTCHEHMQDHIHQVRVQGYAEALAAGLYPGQPFETLPADMQDSLMRQAANGVQTIDEIRSDLATKAEQRGEPTQH